MGDNIAKYRFDAFGGMFAGVLAPYSFQGITGKEYDPKSGLMYYNSRWYNPQIGRFTQPDSFKGYITNPVSQHPYAYVGNNPINRIDPTGHDSDIPEWLDWDDDGQVDWDQDDSDTFDQDGDNVADWLQDDYSDEWEYNDGTGWDWVGGGSGGSSSDGDWGYGDDGGYSGGGGSSYHEPTKAEPKTAFTGVAGRSAASVGLPKAKPKPVPPSTQAVKNKVMENIPKTRLPLPMKSEKNQKVEKVVQQVVATSVFPSVVINTQGTSKQPVVNNSGYLQLTPDQKAYFEKNPDIAPSDPIGNTIIDTFSTAFAGGFVNLVKSAIQGIVKKVVAEEGANLAGQIPLNLQLFAKKKDIGQIESIAKEFKMTPQQRREFGDYTEFLKKHVPNNKNFSYKELKEKAREFLDE